MQAKEWSVMTVERGHILLLSCEREADVVRVRRKR